MRTEIRTLVEEVSCSDLDLSDSFFDSLRDFYGDEFNRWFIDKCVLGHRNSFAIREDGKLYALCIYKIEHDEPINSEGYIPFKDTLKICTFKVADEARGAKLGENLLQSVFYKCFGYEIPFIYLTTGVIQMSLIKLLEEFGFHQFGTIESRGAKDADCVYGKWVFPTSNNPMLDKDSFAREYFPSYMDDPSVGKHLVPIRPEWHEKLFPDISNFRGSLFGKSLQFQESEGNAIRKAYVCRSSTNRIEPGDLLYFYRSKDRRSVEVYGVVRTSDRTMDITAVMNLVKGRTVYAKDDISLLIEGASNGLLVLSFDLLGFIQPAISAEDMRNNGIPIPQSIASIDEKAYVEFFKQKQLWQQY